MASGWKTYLAGGAMMAYAIAAGILGLLGYDEYGIDPNQAIELFLSGLAIIGIGHKIAKSMTSRFISNRVLLLALCLASSTAVAADISGPSEVTPCSGLVRLATTVEAGHVLRWEVVQPRVMEFIIYDDNRAMAFAAPARAQTITVLLVDVWQDTDGPRVLTTLHDLKVAGGPEPEPDDPDNPDPPTPPEPDDPDPPTPPEPEPTPVIPDDLLGIARVAFVEAYKLPKSDRAAAGGLSDSFSSVAASIAAGTTRSVDAAKSEIKEKVDAALGANAAKWQPWRDEIAFKLDELQGVGLLKTVQDYASQCRLIAEGLKRVDAASQPPAAAAPPKQTPAAVNATREDRPLVLDRFQVVTISGKRYGRDTQTGQLYPVDEQTKSFCGVIDGQRRCYFVRD